MSNASFEAAPGITLHKESRQVGATEFLRWLTGVAWQAMMGDARRMTHEGWIALLVRRALAPSRIEVLVSRLRARRP